MTAPRMNHELEALAILDRYGEGSVEDVTPALVHAVLEVADAIWARP